MTPQRATLIVQRARGTTRQAWTCRTADAIAVGTVRLAIAVFIHTVRTICLRHRRITAIRWTIALVLTANGVAKVVATRIGATVDRAISTVLQPLADTVTTAIGICRLVTAREHILTAPGIGAVYGIRTRPVAAAKLSLCRPDLFAITVRWTGQTILTA